MNLRPLCAALLPLCVSAVSAFAQTPASPKPPIVNDPALKIELIASYPDVEACTTVCSAPDGSIYVGNDPRDGRLNTDQPVNTIIRFQHYITPPGAPSYSKRQRTVFADKLYSPAGSAWHDGYLYVLHDPLLTRFKDTDGDGVADVREDLVTNLGIKPNAGLNDHVVSGFTLGMDGYFYISVGDRGIFQAKSLKDGSTISMQGGGIVRCLTDGTRLEVFSTGTRNHLQVNLDAEDNAFTRDNTDDGNGWWTRLTHHIEGGYYGYPYDFRKVPNYGVVKPSEQTLNAIKQHRYTAVDSGKLIVDSKNPSTSPALPTPSAPDSQKSPEDSTRLSTINSPLLTSLFLPAMADFGGGSPTGGLCYLSDGLPEQYRGKHFFSEWGKAGIFVTEVKRAGATFEFVSDTKLVEPDKGGEFRPMQISVAADGSILIADWGYGGWKSPRTAGAIWRLSWPEAKPAPRLKDESKASVDELIAALGHPDRDQRLRAQASFVNRTLAELAPEDAGRRWTENGNVRLIIALTRDASRPRIQRMHALWAWEALADVEMGYMFAEMKKRGGWHGDGARQVHYRLSSMLQDGDETFRAQSTRAWGQLAKVTVPLVVRVPGDWIDKNLVDSEPLVRLSAAIAAAKAGTFTDAYGKALIDPDPSVRFAVRIGLRDLMRRGWSAPGNPKTPVTENLAAAIRSDDGNLREAAWQVLPPSLEPPMVRDASSHIKGWPGVLEVLGKETMWILEPILSDTDAKNRARAVTALAGITYQPQPYDGHWWGTQPVKSAPPLKSVAWVETARAISGLTAALADVDSGVRLAAAKAFSSFTIGGAGSVASQAPSGEDGPDPTALKVAEQSATAALRSRLTAETDAAVRRQLIESLGVQKDPQAMDVFRQIALDEKADGEFRDTAIAAVVNIGGDGAKKVITQLAAASLSPAAARKIITAAGELKVLEAAPALMARLKDENAANREAAAKSLQQLGPKSNAGPALIEAMADKDGKVQAAAVDALGSYRERGALPGIIALLEKKKHLRETTGALALMPDESAIPVLVETLRDKNTTFRRNAIKALKVMRDKARPQVEALLASGRVPEELIPEIKNAFDSGAIVRWKMVGVFENVWEAVHPPEKDILEAIPAEGRSVGGASQSRAGSAGGTSEAGLGSPAYFARKYHNAEGKDVGWIDVTADSEVGRVDLERVFKSNAMVCAYAITEIEADEASEAKLFTSADDEIAVWLNGQRVLNQPGNNGYDPDRNETPLKLAAGKNILFMKIGNKGGSWVFHARIPGFDNGKFTKPKDLLPDEKQRLFALATKPDGSYANAGNAKNGEKLFFDQTAPLGGICATCHAVNGKGGTIGPDLSAIAANYKRPDLITSIHEPNKTIALGFEQVMVETKSGESITGALRQEAADALTIVSADAQSHTVKKADIKTNTHIPTSLMPAGLTLGLKPGDFADLLAFLETLKGK